ncbi:hypothetical protein [Mameliella sp.]|uniref:hypothetical protein n=1 Tax=Mameliella sp. TaxID=1924940 RepID=UPI003BAA4E14
MRLVGILATCFVLLAALIYGFQHRDEIALQFADRIKDMMPAELAVVDAHDLPVTSVPTEVVMPMREAGRLNAFTGFPGYTKATFALPRNSVPQSGVLVLDLDGDLEPGAQGTLRITVNGVRRTELVLDEGRLRRRIMVPLNIRDLSGRNVVVALSAEGRAPQAECSADWAGGVVAQVMPSSHVKLVVDAPITDPADLLLSNMAPLRLEWPGDHRLRAQALKAAHLHSVRQGAILFADSNTGGLTLNEDLLKVLEDQADHIQDNDEDPLDLVSAFGRKRSVSFEGEAQWRVTYDRRQFPRGAAASQLDFAMTYDAAGGASGWLLSVRLNDRLVHSEKLTSASGRVARSIQLPSDEQQMINDVRVVLTSAEKREGRCAPGRPATADIEIARLTLAEPEPDTPWGDLQAVLSGELHVEAHSQLDAVGAQLSLDLMNSILGGDALLLNAELSDATSLPLVTAVPIKALPSFLQQVDHGTSWIVMPAVEDEQELTIVRAANADQGLFASAPRAVLVVQQRPHYSSAKVQ